MADFKISELDAISGSSVPATSDFIVNDTTAGTSAAVTKRINLGELKTAIGGGFAPMLISFGSILNINKETDGIPSTNPKNKGDWVDEENNLQDPRQTDSQVEVTELATVSKSIELPFGSNSAMLIMSYYDEIRFFDRDADLEDQVIQTITNTIRTVTFTNASLSTGGNTVTYENFSIRSNEDNGRQTMAATKMLNISRNGSSTIVMEIKLDFDKWRKPNLDTNIADVMVFPYAA